MIFPLLYLPLAVGWKVLHLADFHLDVDYSTSGDNQKMCHNETGGTNGTLGQYGDYMCDSPKSLVDYSVREAFRILPNPDMILWTGDNVPHVDNYTMDYVVNAINITTRAILSSFNGTRYILPTFGNHDYAPANAFVRNSTLYVSTWELWKGLIADDQKANFLSGGYYKTVLPNATFLVLNTNLYYNANTAYPSFDNQSDPAGMFAFMESELQAAAACKNRVQGNCSSIVHVVAHIPPGVFEKTPNFTWFRDEYNKKFLDITVRYKDTIKWMLYGHHHTDTFHLVKDGNTTVQCSFMSPAVTPWFSSLPGAGANNPAFRVYDVEDDINFRINDILTYYVNLTELNSNPNAQFKLEYTFKTAYNLTNGIDAAAMDGLFAKMKTDNSVFQKYINYNSIMWDSHLPTGQYRGAQLCSIEWSDYDQYNKCMVGYNESGSSTTQSPNNSTSSDNPGGNGKGSSLWKNNILVLFVLLFY